MKKAAKEDITTLADIFTRRKKQIAIAFIVNVVLMFIALAFIGVKILYPYHFVIGFGFYIISFIPLIYRIYISRKVFERFHTYNFAKDYYSHKKWRVFLAFFLAVLMISFFTVRPSTENPFRGMSNLEIEERVDEDLKKAVIAMDYLESSGNELLEILAKKQETIGTADETRTRFNKFIKAVIYSESLTDLHRYFDSIPRFKLRDSRTKSFIISYSLYVKKYEIVQRMITTISEDETKKKILNEENSLLKRDNIYQEMASRYYKPKTKLRINLGWSYMKVFFGSVREDFGESFLILQTKSNESFAYLFNNSDKALKSYLKVSSDGLESRMFETWFPVQKNVANTMGHIILANEDKREFITRDQILKMNEVMEPGDIMLQRRIAHLSNVGIPGFWTHSALYTGSMQQMNDYFIDEFPVEDKNNFEEYTKENFPLVYAEYQKKDKDGEERSTLEAIESGVVLQSLTVSAKADFVVVLRPKLTKSDRLKAVLRAFENFGKPYDYNFDFDTRDAFVCSELVYDAYLEVPGKKEGLEFETSLVSGRKIVSPTDMAHKFSKEENSDKQELEFIYILIGNENTRRAYIGSKEDFLDSLNWGKFNFL